MKRFFLALITVCSVPAFSGTVTLDCNPVKAMTDPLHVSWDVVTDVTSIHLVNDSATGSAAVDVKMLVNSDKNPESVTFKVGNEIGMGLNLIQTSSGLDFDAVVLHITDVAMSNAPAPVPGDYPATATLVMVAAHRPGPGLPEIMDTRSVDFNCRYVLKY